MAKVEVGDRVPQFKVNDHKGFELTDEDLTGTSYVIYFYPRDATPGCTTEACQFRDNLKMFDQLETVVLGVSPDSPESHQKFIEKQKLTFTLLSDEKKKMCQSFGVIKDEKVQRTTFVIDIYGIVKWIERPVKVEGHVDRVIKAVSEHCPIPGKDVKSFNDKYKEFVKKSRD